MQRCKSPSVDHYGCGAVCKTVTLRSQVCSIQTWWTHGNVAQLAEHSTVNRRVDGSSPSVSAYLSEWSNGMTMDCKSIDMSSILILDSSYIIESL